MPSTGHKEEKGKRSHWKHPNVPKKGSKVHLVRGPVTSRHIHPTRQRGIKGKRPKGQVKGDLIVLGKDAPTPYGASRASGEKRRRFVHTSKGSSPRKIAELRKCLLRSSKTFPPEKRTIFRTSERTRLGCLGGETALYGRRKKGLVA